MWVVLISAPTCLWASLSLYLSHKVVRSRIGRLQIISKHKASISERENTVWHWIYINIQWWFSFTASAFIIKFILLTIPFPRLFLSYPYLSLPHLPHQLSSCFTLSLSFPPRKKRTLSKSKSDLNQAEETLSHKQPFPSTFFHSYSDLHPSGSREIFRG